MKFENETFKDTIVTLDYNEFVSCTFERCRILFHGGGFAISKPKMIDTQFVFREAAQHTLVLLNLLNKMDASLTRSLIDQAASPALS
jgi:hypothetical protein